MSQVSRLARKLLLTSFLLLVVIAGSGFTSQDKPFTIWTKFNAQSPQNTQDKWLAETLKDFTTQTGKAVTHVSQPFDQINSKLNLAVQAEGAVPDLSYVDGQQLGFFVQNGTLTDLTNYVKNASWFKDLNPAALASCTTPDGKILCVPSSVATTLIYYWTDGFPQGFPATTDKMLDIAKILK